MDLCLLLGGTLSCVDASGLFTFNIVDIGTVSIWVYQLWWVSRKIEIVVKVKKD